MIHNLVEDRVFAAYDTLREHFPEFCGCEMCRADVLVFTLNRMPPRYVVSPQGSALTGLHLEKDQNRATIDVTMMEAFRRVSLAPRCGRDRAPGGSA